MVKSALLWSAFLLFLIQYSLLSAQKETTTSGSSGPKCSNGVRCLHRSKCLWKKKMCLCPTSYKGNGRLSCAKEDESVLFLQSDPELINFINERIPIKTPCPTRLIKYSLPDMNSVEVYALTKLFKNGKYYANGLEARFCFKKEKQLVNYSILIEGSAKDGIYEFKEWRKGTDDQTWKLPNSNDTFEDFQIKVTYDQVDNFAKIDAEDGFGIKVSFRPVDGAKQTQLMAPGIVVYVSDAIKYQMHVSNDELSSSPDGPSVHDAAVAHRATIEEWAIYSSMSNVKAIESFEDSCKSIYTDFNTKCGNQITRIASVKACSAIYTDPTFLKCLIDGNVPSELQAQLYQQCQQAVCTMHYGDCVTLNDMLMHETKCKLPKGLCFCNIFL